jgi:hypothetical protein
MRLAGLGIFLVYGLSKRQHLDGGLPKLVHRKIDTRVLADQRESRQIVVTLGNTYNPRPKSSPVVLRHLLPSKAGRISLIITYLSCEKCKIILKYVFCYLLAEVVQCL